MYLQCIFDLLQDILMILGPILALIVGTMIARSIILTVIEITTIVCTTCGTWNDAERQNCAHCGHNLHSQ